MAVEVRGVIASRQGLSCAGYTVLMNRTRHLRDSLYITVRDGEAGMVFRPRDYPPEHFPFTDIENYYRRQCGKGLIESIGAGGGEVIFTLEGPGADEGAEIITRALVELEEVLNRPYPERLAYSRPEKWAHVRAILEDPWTMIKVPYRPEGSQRAARPGPPPKPAATAAPWQRSLRQPDPYSPQPWQQTSWREAPWM